MRHRYRGDMPPARSGSAATLADILRNQIVAGLYKPGDRLPATQDLAAAYHVVRNTAAKALRILVEEGLAEVRYGVGTFVRQPPRREPIGPAAYARSRWGGLQMPAVAVAREPADEAVATALGLAPGTIVGVRRRLVGTQRGPTHLVTSYYPPGVAVADGRLPGLHDDGFALVEGAHEVIESLRCRLATAEEAARLRLPVGGSVVEVRRVTRDADGRPVEHGVGVYLADAFEWTFRFTIPD